MGVRGLRRITEMVVVVVKELVRVGNSRKNSSNSRRNLRQRELLRVAVRVRVVRLQLILLQLLLKNRLLLLLQNRRFRVLQEEEVMVVLKSKSKFRRRQL